MFSKASLSGSVAFHGEQDWTRASPYQLTHRVRSASSSEALLPFVKTRAVHHIPKSSTCSLLQMHQKLWHPITCQSHSNSIEHPHKFSCMFFFSHFGFPSGLGLMPGIPALSDGGWGWVSRREGVSFLGPALLRTHRPMVSNWPAAPRLFTI